MDVRREVIETIIAAIIDLHNNKQIDPETLSTLHRWLKTSDINEYNEPTDN